LDRLLSIDLTRGASRAQDADYSPIGSEVICDQLVWDKAVLLQKLAHQFERRPLVASGFVQNVKDFTLGVDSSPQEDLATNDFQIDFVKMPSCMGLGSAFAQVRCDLRPKMDHPAPNGLAGDYDARSANKSSTSRKLRVNRR
jgi:hypothetical protein